MLIEAQDSTLLVIDVQERLLPGVHEHETLVKNCRWLIEVAQLMDVPVRFTEQYPKASAPPPTNYWSWPATPTPPSPRPYSPAPTRRNAPRCSPKPAARRSCCAAWKPTSV